MDHTVWLFEIDKKWTQYSPSSIKPMYLLFSTFLCSQDDPLLYQPLDLKRASLASISQRLFRWIKTDVLKC